MTRTKSLFNDLLVLIVIVAIAYHSGVYVGFNRGYGRARVELVNVADE